MFHIDSPVSPQRGRTLGARMKNAFEVLLRGADAAILIGTDSPTLPPRFLIQARRMLRGHDVVLGPAEDGGYYLIGLSRNGFQKSETLFSKMAWGGPGVFTETLRRAKRRGLRVFVLPAWYDIDTIDDLKRPEIVDFILKSA